MAQADADEHGSAGKADERRERELAGLRRRTRSWSWNEILKRATAYFARENVLSSDIQAGPRADRATFWLRTWSAVRCKN